MPEEYLLPAFHFGVSIDSAPKPVDASFLEVGGLTSTMTTEEVVEGGENRFVWKLPGAVKHGNLTLKRGLAPQSSSLVSWCQRVFEGGLSTSILTRSVRVFLYNGEQVAVRAWAFHQAYPVAWKIDTFSSNKNDLAIENIELAYQNSERLL